MSRYQTFLSKLFRLADRIQSKTQIDNNSRRTYKPIALISFVSVTSLIIAYFSDKIKFSKTYALSFSKQDESFTNREARITPTSKHKTVPIVQTHSQSNNVRFDSSAIDTHHEAIQDYSLITLFRKEIMSQ